MPWVREFVVKGARRLGATLRLPREPARPLVGAQIQNRKVVKRFPEKRSIKVTIFLCLVYYFTISGAVSGGRCGTCWSAGAARRHPRGPSALALWPHQESNGGCQGIVKWAGGAFRPLYDRKMREMGVRRVPGAREFVVKGARRLGAALRLPQEPVRPLVGAQIQNRKVVKRFPGKTV